MAGGRAQAEEPMSRPWNLAESEVTPEGLYVRRREFLALGAAGALGMAGAAMAFSCKASAKDNPNPGLPIAKRGAFATDEKQTPLDDVTSYNNYYEFGTDKGDPAANAGPFRTRPWTVAADGEIKKPQT